MGPSSIDLPAVLERGWAPHTSTADSDQMARRAAICSALKQQGTEAFLSRHLPQIRYTTGFTGSSGLIILSLFDWVLLVDSRYTDQAKTETKGVEVREIQGKLEESVSRVIKELRIQRMGYEAERTSVALLDILKEKAPRRTEWSAQNNWLDALRAIKDKGEIHLVRKAADLASQACRMLVKWIKPGVMELDIAAELEFWMRKQGAEKLSFDPVIASGPRSGFPHSRASVHRLPAKGWVVVDFGALVRGYSSDMTRTFYLGRPNKEDRRWYRAVQEAQEKAIRFLRPGRRSDEPYWLVKKSLKRHRLDELFTHGLGHGIGLELHEVPSLSYKAPERLYANMIVTVEPGVYLPNQAGIRIEDMVLLTSNGCELLTDFSRDLLVL